MRSSIDSSVFSPKSQQGFFQHRSSNHLRIQEHGDSQVLTTNFYHQEHHNLNEKLQECIINSNSNLNLEPAHLDVRRISEQLADFIVSGIKRFRNTKIGSRVEEKMFSQLQKRHFMLLEDIAVDENAYLGKSVVFDKKLTKKKSQQPDQLSQQFARYNMQTIFKKHMKRNYEKLHIFLKRKVAQMKPLDPNHWLITFIYILSFGISVILLFIESVRIGFQVDREEEQQIKVIERLAIFIYVLEVGINLNVGYYEMGKLINNRSMIFNNYKQNSLYYDIITLSVLIYSVSYHSYDWLQMIVELPIFLKIYSMGLIKKNLQAKFLKYDVSNPYYLLISLITLCLVVAHCVAIVWNIINRLELAYYTPVEDIWYYKTNLIDADWSIQYINCYYWSLNTMVTGGNSPVPVYEIYFSLLIMVFCFLIFSYVITKVGQIVEEINRKVQKYKHELIMINQYMSQKEISQDLQGRVVNYLEYLQKGYQDIQKGQELNDLLGKLPVNLKDEIQLEINTKAFKSFKFLSKYFSEKTLKQVAAIITEEQYMPNQIIFNSGDCSNFALYVVYKGSVETIMCRPPNKSQNDQDWPPEMVGTNSSSTLRKNTFSSSGSRTFNNFNFDEPNQTLGGGHGGQFRHHEKKVWTFATLGEEREFGKASFFKGNEQSYTAKSTEFTTVYKIDREQFIEIIKHNDHDFEQFMMIRDELLTEDASETVDTKCKVCRKQHMTQIGCPLVNYVADKKTIIDKYSQQKNRRVKCEDQLVKAGKKGIKGPRGMTELSGANNSENFEMRTFKRSSKIQEHSQDNSDDDYDSEDVYLKPRRQKLEKEKRLFFYIEDKDEELFDRVFGNPEEIREHDDEDEDEIPFRKMTQKQKIDRHAEFLSDRVRQHYIWKFLSIVDDEDEILDEQFDEESRTIEPQYSLKRNVSYSPKGSPKNTSGYDHQSHEQNNRKSNFSDYTSKYQPQTIQIPKKQAQFQQVMQDPDQIPEESDSNNDSSTLRKRGTKKSTFLMKMREESKVDDSSKENSFLNWEQPAINFIPNVENLDELSDPMRQQQLMMYQQQKQNNFTIMEEDFKQYQQSQQSDRLGSDRKMNITPIKSQDDKRSLDKSDLKNKLEKIRRDDESEKLSKGELTSSHDSDSKSQTSSSSSSSSSKQSKSRSKRSSSSSSLPSSSQQSQNSSQDEKKTKSSKSKGKNKHSSNNNNNANNAAESKKKQKNKKGSMDITNNKLNNVRKQSQDSKDTPQQQPSLQSSQNQVISLQVPNFGFSPNLGGAGGGGGGAGGKRPSILKNRIEIPMVPQQNVGRRKSMLMNAKRNSQFLDLNTINQISVAASQNNNNPSHKDSVESITSSNINTTYKESNQLNRESSSSSNQKESIKQIMTPESLTSFMQEGVGKSVKFSISEKRESSYYVNPPNNNNNTASKEAEFDKIKDFQTYFPWGNCKLVSVAYRIKYEYLIAKKQRKNPTKVDSKLQNKGSKGGRQPAKQRKTLIIPSAFTLNIVSQSKRSSRAVVFSETAMNKLLMPEQRSNENNE